LLNGTDPYGISLALSNDGNTAVVTGAINTVSTAHGGDLYNNNGTVVFKRSGVDTTSRTIPL